MNNYILPICFAAAAHGALLFGFTKHPRSFPTPPEERFLTPFVIRDLEEERPAVVDTDRTEATPRNAPDVPQPIRTPEPPVVDIDTPNKPTMELPPIQTLGLKDMTRVPGTLGVPGGDGTAPWSNGVMSSVELDATPRTRFQAAPQYPFEAKSTGTHGEVHVDFIVDERGRVIDPRIVRSSNRIFDEPTLRAVSKWQFEPGRRHGKIVKFRMMVPVIFNLSEGS